MQKNTEKSGFQQTATNPFEIRPIARGTKPEDRTAEVLIYGEIGESWDGETVAARHFVKDLQSLDADILTTRINSYGGSVSDGLAIFNALKRHSAVIDMHIDGVAVSIASLIAMAGDTVTMPDNALMMIHAPWGMSMGNARTMRDMADTLDKHAQAMTSAYRRAGVDPEQIAAWLNDGNDHWLTANEAKAAGLVDIISAPLAIAASLPPRFRGTSRAHAAQPRQPEDSMAKEIKAAAPDEQPTTPVATPEQEPLTEPTTTSPTDAAPPEPTDKATAAAAPAAAPAPDVHAAVQAAIAAERKRVAAITARCNQVGMTHLAQALIDAGADMAACNAAIVDAYVAKGGPEIRQTTEATPMASDADAQRKIRDAYARINQQITNATKRPE